MKYKIVAGKEQEPAAALGRLSGIGRRVGIEYRNQMLFVFDDDDGHVELLPAR